VAVHFARSRYREAAHRVGAQSLARANRQWRCGHPFTRICRVLTRVPAGAMTGTHRDPARADTGPRGCLLPFATVSDWRFRVFGVSESAKANMLGFLGTATLSRKGAHTSTTRSPALVAHVPAGHARHRLDVPARGLSPPVASRDGGNADRGPPALAVTAALPRGGRRGVAAGGARGRHCVARPRGYRNHGCRSRLAS
jgi:hypothetical protein